MPNKLAHPAMKFATLIINIFLLKCWSAFSQEDNAGFVWVKILVSYECRFTSRWTKERHPIDYLTNKAHWSTPMLVSHDSKYTALS